MQIPAEIVFHRIEPSDAVEQTVRERIDQLERYYGRIISCRVVIDRPHHHHRKGNIYSVRVDLTVPGHEIVVDHSGSTPRHHAHEDMHVAVRDAFDAVRRRLEDHVRRMRGKVKVHEHWPEGRVATLEPEQGFGFIETADGRSIYFHRNSVLDDHFDDLDRGSRVSFVEELGEEGPQASTVRLQ